MCIGSASVRKTKFPKNKFMTKFKFFPDLYDYKGAVVVLTRPVCEFAGEEEPANFCKFCKGLFRRVVIHLKNVHQSEPRVAEIIKLDSAAERAAEFEQLLREGNFYVNNAQAMATQEGFVIPTRKSPHFRAHTSLVHCTSCFMLMEKYNYNRHIDRCARKSSKSEGDPPATSLWEEKQSQFSMLVSQGF
jgi:hypothetical protein